MSKKSKSAARDKRKIEKKKRKDSMRAVYASWREASQNSKRSQLKKARSHKIRLARHLNGPCRNIGCARCFPHLPKHPKMNSAPEKAFN